MAQKVIFMFSFHIISGPHGMAVYNKHSKCDGIFDQEASNSSIHKWDTENQSVLTEKAFWKNGFAHFTTRPTFLVALKGVSKLFTRCKYFRLIKVNQRLINVDPHNKCCSILIQ